MIKNNLKNRKLNFICFSIFIFSAVIGPYISIFKGFFEFSIFRVLVSFLFLYIVFINQSLTKNQIHIMIFFIFWAFYSCAQILFSSSYSESIYHMQVLWVANIFFSSAIGVSVFYFFQKNSLNNLRLFSWSWVFIGLIFNTMAFYEIVTAHPIFNNKILDFGYGNYTILERIKLNGGHAAVVSFSNPNDLSIYFCSIVFFSLYLLLVEEVFYKKILLSISFFLSTLVIFINASRISIFISILFFIMYFFGKNGFYKKILILFFVILVVFLFLNFLSYENLESARFFKKMLSFFDFVFERNSRVDHSSSERISLYFQAVKYFFSSFFVGTGPEGFYINMIDGNTLLPYGTVPNPHSFYLGLLAESGILIFLFFIGILIFIYKKSKKIACSEKFFLRCLLIWNILGSFESSSSIKTPIFWILFFLMYVSSTFLSKINDNQFSGDI